jgi:hypothetical protein
MNMHKCKGKEFDAVIIPEGLHHARLLDFIWDARRTTQQRRLLRVAITRARHLVVFVRPADAVPLVPPQGHPGRAHGKCPVQLIPATQTSGQLGLEELTRTIGAAVVQVISSVTAPGQCRQARQGRGRLGL